MLRRGTARRRELADALDALGDVLREIIESGGFDAAAFLDPRVGTAADTVADRVAGLRDATLRQTCDPILGQYRLLATLAPPGAAAQSWAAKLADSPSRSELLHSEVKQARRCLEALDPVARDLGGGSAIEDDHGRI